MTDTSKSPTPTDRAISLMRGKKIVESTALLGPGGEVLIRHQDRIYRLRLTRFGKLILTA